MAARLRTLKPLLRTAALPRIGKTLRQGNSGQRLTGKRLQQRRQRMFAEQPLCVDCMKAGRVTAAEELDHEVALWEGGADTEENSTPRCFACHKRKTALETRRRYGGGHASF